MNKLTFESLNKMTSEKYKHVSVIGVNRVIDAMGINDLEYFEQGSKIKAEMMRLNLEAGYIAVIYKSTSDEGPSLRMIADKVAKEEIRPVWMIFEHLS